MECTVMEGRVTSANHDSTVFLFYQPLVLPCRYTGPFWGPEARD